MCFFDKDVLYNDFGDDMKYYLFIIKKEYYKNNDFYLYNMLERLKLMDKDNYNYGVDIIKSVCSNFDDKVIINYIDQKYHIRKCGNTYYLNSEDSIKICRGYCLIKTKRHLRELMCLFYIYHKNIFVCNFSLGSYFWLEDEIIGKYVEN